MHKAPALDATDLMQVREINMWLVGLFGALQAIEHEFEPQQLEDMFDSQLQGELRPQQYLVLTSAPEQLSKSC